MSDKKLEKQDKKHDKIQDKIQDKQEKLERKETKEQTQKITPNNVISLADNRCLAEGCKSKSKRAGFCDEHFEWFKAGLITKEGKQVMDFDKKYQHFLAGKKAA